MRTGRHVCISSRLYHQFYRDSQAGDDNGVAPSCHDACIGDTAEVVEPAVQVQFFFFFYITLY